MEKTGESGERKYSTWNALALSFYSRDLYVDVGKNWKGTGFGALFLILVLVFLPRAASVQWQVVHELPGYLKKIPDFKIEKGVFSADVQQPYTLEIGTKGGIIIDTTGKINSLDQIPGIQDKDDYYLFTKTKFMSRRHRFGTVEDKTRDMFKVNLFVLNQEKLRHWYDLVIPWVGIVYYLFCVLFGFLMEVVVLLVYGLFGVLFSEIRKNGLDYNVALRLAVVSHIPALVISTLFVVCGVHLPWPALWSFAVSMGFLSFAVSSQEPAVAE